MNSLILTYLVVMFPALVMSVITVQRDALRPLQEQEEIKDAYFFPRRFPPPPHVAQFRTLSQQAYQVGERLVFDVKFGYVKAGEGTFWIATADTLYGRTTYRIIFSARSASSFDWIYKVDDRFDTFIDSAGIFPWRFSQRLREGRYKNDYTADFDQYNNVAHAGDKQILIPPYVHDIVSAFFYVRTMDFSSARMNQRFTLNNFFKDSTYQLTVRYLGTQRVEVAAGKFDCIMIEPLIKEGGLFKTDGRIVLWLTSDERKVPIKVHTKIGIGAIEAELRTAEGVLYPWKGKL